MSQYVENSIFYFVDLFCGAGGTSIGNSVHPLIPKDWIASIYTRLLTTSKTLKIA